MKELTVFSLTKGVAGQMSIIVEERVIPKISEGCVVPEDEDENRPGFGIL